MSKLSHVYLHLASVGEPEACAMARANLRPILKSVYAGGEIRGYRLFMLKGEQDAEEELLPYMFDYVSVTNGRFPIVYAMVTPLEDDKLSLDEFMQKHGFQRCR